MVSTILPSISTAISAVATVFTGDRVRDCGDLPIVIDNDKATTEITLSFDPAKISQGGWIRRRSR